MLLACLQRQCEPIAAIAVDGAADDAARHLPHQVFLAAHETEIRTTAHHRHTQRLPLADRDIRTGRAPQTRRLEQRQRGRVDHSDDQRTLGMRPVGQHIDLFQDAEEIRLLDHQRGNVLACVLPERIGQCVAALRAVRQLDQFDTLILYDGMRGLAVMRVHRGRHQDAV
jgi:hypothetical protein